ncbi:putative integral membrane protein (TIGR00698 family) [Dyadobacter jejuensis]|uniref:Putative integral membrane protein (TIGR00698 family) n=1 Tax=Dyadobacter jejuensis TaxID=1082580 RepID=A0A316AKC2_9BACT|nr:putative sulfate exporter family transporter [Dyadobacter jejuensis]PWJ57952.1 putative integral membrane protein (TIGR00698 family) [Dyadobacter jejuensis]
MDFRESIFKKEFPIGVHQKTRIGAFVLVLTICATPFVGAVGGLVMGVAFALVLGHPYLEYNHKVVQWLLQASVVGLGFGMDLQRVIQVGARGVLLTMFSIVCTLALGYGLGKAFRVDPKVSFLISAGTAICGGSAIAALSPVIRAKERQVSLALACIFILNALALLVFPWLGHYFGLSQRQFGLWCALAIHDTSSVVGAAGVYGVESLELATTVKLARALWIIPISCISTFYSHGAIRRIRIPYFIGLFLVAVLANNFIPAVANMSYLLGALAHIGLKISLFLIGTGLTRSVWKTVGLGPFLQGLLLWVLISFLGLLLVAGWHF